MLGDKRKPALERSSRSQDLTLSDGSVEFVRFDSVDEHWGSSGCEFHNTGTFASVRVSGGAIGNLHLRVSDQARPADSR